MDIILGPDIRYFLWSVAAGFGLAVCYDAVRLLRRLIPHSDLAVNIEDIIFIVAAGLAAAGAAYMVNNGFFRIYSLFSMAGGFFVYRIIFGNKAVLLAERMVKLLLMPIRAAAVLLCKPFLLMRRAADKRRGQKKAEKQGESGKNTE